MTKTSNTLTLVFIASLSFPLFAAPPTLDRTCVVGDEKNGCVMYGPSFTDLLANSERYDGKVVRIIGYVRLDKVRYEESGDSVYLSKEAADHDLAKEGFWLDLSGTRFGPEEKKPEGYVIIEGEFSAQNRGHKGLWSGSLNKISRFAKWK